MALPTDSDPLLIVGAGPTGLTLACELARRNVPVRIIEARTEREPLSKALGVHARTLEVFADIGIADAAVERGRPLGAANVYSEGEQVAHVTLDRLQSRYPFVLILPQHETEELLEQRLGELGVEVERGATMRSVRNLSDGVEIEIEIDGDIDRARAPWVIACDGSASPTREALGIGFDGTDYDEDFALADMELGWDRSYDEVHAFLSVDGLVAVFPLPKEHHVRVAVDVTDRDPGELTSEFFGSLLSDRGAGHVEPKAPTWVSRFRIRRRMVESYRVGRCFLAGDAAHVHSPAGGQGMNTGIQDAYNLGWKLAAVYHGRAAEGLLDTYDEERRPVARATLRGTDFATRIGMWNQPLARAVRGTVAGWLSSIDAVQDRITRTVAELDVNYRRSSIAEEEIGTFPGAGPIADRVVFGRGPRPGDRAPDVELPSLTPDHLHGWLFGPTAVLLVFVTDVDACNDAALVANAVAGALPDAITPVVVIEDAMFERSLKWTGRVLLDATGEVQRAYGASRSCLYLIRPDGYVGFRSDSLDARSIMRFVERVRGKR